MLSFILFAFILGSTKAEVCYQIDTVNNCVKDGTTPCSNVVTIETTAPNKICENGFKNNQEITSIIYQGTNMLTIKASAFEGATKLTSISANNGIEDLEISAFKECTSLTTIDLSHVIIIPASCFEGCTSLKTVTSMENVQYFNNFAFFDSGLESLSFGENVKKIGNYVFKNTKLESVNLPKSNPSDGFGTNVFENCANLTTVDFKGVTIVPEYTFSGCVKLTTLTNIDKVTHFKEKSFYISKLSSITFGSSVAELGSDAFSLTQLSSVTLPDQIESFGIGVFETCISLKEVTINKNLNIPNRTFFGDTFLVTVNGFDKITSFGSESFRHVGLKEIRFGNAVTKLAGNAFAQTKLEKITFGNEQIDDFEPGAFQDMVSLTTVTLKGTTKIPDNTFKGCTLLEHISDFSVITSFGQFSFEKTKISLILFGDDVTQIKDGAFKEITSKMVTLPSSTITDFGKGVFENAVSLHTVDLGGTISIPESTFKGCTSLEVVMSFDKIKEFGIASFEQTRIPTITFGNSITKLGNGAFKSVKSTAMTFPSTQILEFGTNVFENANELKDVDLNGQLAIADFTFKGCSSIKDIKNIDKVETIGISSFESTGLTNVYFSTALKKLGDGAFKNTRLTELTLPNIEILELGEGVFANVTTFKKAILGGTTKIPKDTFKGCILLNEVDGFEKVTYYGDNCFESAVIQNVTFAENVDKLGSNAFEGNSMTHIQLPHKPIKDFGENVFKNCLNLVSIDFGGNTVIPPGTLKRCDVLTLVSGTENVKLIGKDAFKQTNKLQSLNLYGKLETLLDPLESQSNLFYHGNEVPKTLPSDPLLKADLRIFVTEKFKANKFGDNVVMKLNCSITQFIDVSEPNPMCKNCEEMKATLDGDNYYCDLDMTECLSTHQKCQICIEGKCQKCEEKLFVDTVKDVCVSECPNGYYDGTVICEKCKEHYEKPCKDEECEKCTGGVGGIVIAALVAILLFMF